MVQFRKTQEERAGKNAQKAAMAHAASPLGRAESAHERGDSFFQVELELSAVLGGWANTLSSALDFVLPNRAASTKSVDLLGDIERIGWHLEHVGYVYVQTGSESTAHDEDSRSTSTSGRTMGIYLFRRVDSDVVSP